jgi:hypothetical protein
MLNDLPGKRKQPAVWLNLADLFDFQVRNANEKKADILIRLTGFRIKIEAVSKIRKMDNRSEFKLQFAIV